MDISSNDGHWRESVFGSEIMSSLAEAGKSSPLSEITIRSMEDIGYKVDRSQADPYVIPPVAKPVAADAVPFCIVSSLPPRTIPIHEDW